MYVTPSIAARGDSRRELERLWRLAVPLIIGYVGNQIMTMVDTIMVGRLGAVALAGVGAGNQCYFAVTIFASGVILGMEAPVAQAVGAGDRRRARLIFWQGARVALLLSLPAMALILASPSLARAYGVKPEIVDEMSRYIWARVINTVPSLLFAAQRSYLQASGRTRPIVLATVIGNFANFVGNVLFMYGDDTLVRLGLPALGLPRLGVVGSGLSSTLASLGMMWALGRAVAKVPAPDAARARRRDNAIIATIFRLGTPLGLQMLAEIGAFSLVGLTTGRLGASASAGHQTALVLASFTFCVTLGIGAAAAVRVGHYVGAGDTAGARRAGLLALGSSAVFMSCSALVFLAAPHLLARIISDDPVVIAGALPLIRVAAVFQLCDGLQATGAGALRGAGDPHAPMLANLVGYYVVGLPLSFTLAYHFGMGARGLWWGLSSGLTVVALGLIARFLVLSSRPIRRV